MKEETGNTENIENKGRCMLTDEELEQASGGSGPFKLQQGEITIFDVVNPDTGLVKDNEDLELNKLVDSPSMGTHYQTLI